jgi:hypothetical protein
MSTRAAISKTNTLINFEPGLSVRSALSLIFNRNAREGEGASLSRLVRNAPLHLRGQFADELLRGNYLTFQLGDKRPQFFPGSLAPSLNGGYCQLQSCCSFLQREALQIT